MGDVWPHRKLAQIEGYFTVAYGFHFTLVNFLSNLIKIVERRKFPSFKCSVRIIITFKYECFSVRCYQNPRLKAKVNTKPEKQFIRFL